MISKEIEIKFEVKNENEIIDKLKALGAEKTKEGFEHNSVFDNGELREKGILLRLRKFGNKNTLTLKTGITKGEFKEANEIEIEVSDFQRMKAVLESLGYGVSWVYEKKTTHFILNGTKISLDRIPFGTYMEIEGTRKGIRDVIEKLGLDPEKGITKTYFELYQDSCKEKEEEMKNLVFWRKSL
ncbi:MAG: class IV adenylate cyclase [Candidatus Aenigmarchaeota archaeon]|nr:class IV adenylate cyclase [Candidatus Aenigmarchaeota archaeon]